MLYFLHELAQAGDSLSWLRVFRYVTTRAGGAAITAFAIVVAFGPLTVRWLSKLQMIAPHRAAEAVGDNAGVVKPPVPSMGGLLIIASLVCSVLMWARPDMSLVHVFLFLIVALGAVGFADDLMKVMNDESRAGMSGRMKLALQIAIGVIALLWLDSVPETRDHIRSLMLPFLKHPVLVGLPGYFNKTFIHASGGCFYRERNPSIRTSASRASYELAAHAAGVRQGKKLRLHPGVSDASPSSGGGLLSG